MTTSIRSLMTLAVFTLTEYMSMANYEFAVDTITKQPLPHPFNVR